MLSVLTSKGFSRPSSVRSLPLAVAALALVSTGAAGGTCSPTTPAADATAADASAEPLPHDAALPADSGPDDGIDGCDGARYVRNPVDTAARGPHPVGARTVMVGTLTAEVWYPAVPGTEVGVPQVRYDLRQQLPPTEIGKVPDDDNPWQNCDCHRDIPLDTAHGPYPVIVFVHGTAGFRHQSLSQVTHWASRGFVVIAADHPGLRLGNLLAIVCRGNPTAPQNLSRDIDTLIAAVASPSGQLAFLADHLDAGRIAVAGHSAGGSAAAAATGKPGVRVVISLAGGRNAAASPGLEQVLFLGGRDDAIAKWDSVVSAYQSSASPKRLAGLAGARHLAFSDLCDTRNAQGQNLLDIATEHAVCGAQFAGQLFDCDPAQLDGPTAWAITNDITSSVLESTLQCRTGLPDPSSIRDRHPEVDLYEESL